MNLLGQKETDQAGGTHVLETAEGGTFQDTKKNRLSKGTHQLEMGERARVRTRKEINRSRGTHILETAEGGTCQDME